MSEPKKNYCKYCKNATLDCNSCVFVPMPSIKPNLNGGSKAKWPHVWQYTRKLVLERDHHVCNMCNCSFNLEVHHIQPRKFGGTDHPRNLITQCTQCHDAFHTAFMEKMAKIQHAVQKEKWETQQNIAFWKNFLFKNGKVSN